MRHHVLFIQGAGAGTHDEWDHKLVASLSRELGADFELHYPRMPDEENPNAARWSAAIEKELGSLGPDAILVGHSIGGTILINMRVACRGVFLLSAPFIGEGGWPSEELEPLTGPRSPAPVFIYQGTRDETVPPAHASLYAKALPQAVIRLLDGRDHQLDNDLSEVAADIRQLL